MPNLGLLETQFKFTVMVGKLIQWATDNGYSLTLGEAYRTPEQAALNAKKGIGIKNSLHLQRLAIDINVFKDGKIAATVPEYEPLGIFWESIGGSWGGRFTSPDSDHFSLSFGGVK